MILFLDTSVLLAACGSTTGAAYFVYKMGAEQGWTLLTSGYCLQETLRNFSKLDPKAKPIWEGQIQPTLKMVPDILAMGERALVFPKAKDRPVVITAQASVLLTLDRTDFHGALGREVYGMRIRTPADFLAGQREA